MNPLFNLAIQRTGGANEVRSRLAGAVIIVFLCLLIYWPAIRGEFVWDDNIYVTNNEETKSSDGLIKFWTTRDKAMCFPVTMSVFWIEWRFFGMNPIGYHVVNVIIHIANAILLWLTLAKLRIPCPWVAALGFAIHPVNVESVAWISEHKNTLSFFFLVLALLAYLRFEDTSRYRWYGGSLAAFLLSLLSKSSVVMFPLVILLCTWWRRGAVSLSDIRRVIPFFALSLVLGLATVWFYHEVKNPGLDHNATGWSALASVPSGASKAILLYLTRVFWPCHLSTLYPRFDPGSMSSLASVLVVSTGLVVLWRHRHTWAKGWLFGICYYLSMLLPMIGPSIISASTYSQTTDHWQYHSIIGVIALTVSVGGYLSRLLDSRSQLPVQVVGILGISTLLSVLTWKHAQLYKDNLTLWTDTLAKNPDSLLARQMVAEGYTGRRMYSEAIAVYREVLAINSGDARVYHSLGNALAANGQLAEATLEFERAARIQPHYPEALLNLGMAYAAQGHLEPALANLTKALQLRPEYPQAHYNLGVLLTRTHQIREAMDQYQQALRLNPNFVEAHYNLAALLMAQGKLDEAETHYREVLHQQPGNARARCNLGVVLLRRGKHEEAIDELIRSLSALPTLPEAHSNLAIALAAQGEPLRALGHFERAIQSWPSDAHLRNEYGVALRNTGRIREAVFQFCEAIRLKPDFAEARNNLKSAESQLGGGS